MLCSSFLCPFNQSSISRYVILTLRVCILPPFVPYLFSSLLLPLRIYFIYPAIHPFVNPSFYRPYTPVPLFIHPFFYISSISFIPPILFLYMSIYLTILLPSTHSLPSSFTLNIFHLSVYLSICSPFIFSSFTSYIFHLCLSIH